MAVQLSQRTAADNPGDVIGTFDQWGQQWRQDPTTGNWQIQQGTTTSWDGSQVPVWTDRNPNATTPQAAFDLSPFAALLQKSLPSQYGTDAVGYYTNNPDQLATLFDKTYSGRDANLNPYGSPQAAAALRQVATKLGLPTTAADEAALREAASVYTATGEPYHENTSGNIVADSILKDLAKQAGVSYAGASPDQVAAWQKQADDYMNYAESHDNDSFGQGAGPLGELAGFRLNTIGNALDFAKNNPKQFLIEGPLTGNWGATPAGSRGLNWANDQLFGASGSDQSFQAQIDQYGDPFATDAAYKDAAGQGYDTSLAAVLSQFFRTVALSQAAPAATSGLENAGLSSNEAALTFSGGLGAATAYGGGGSTADILKQSLESYILSNAASDEATDLTGSSTAGGILGLAQKAYKAYQAYAATQNQASNWNKVQQQQQQQTQTNGTAGGKPIRKRIDQDNTNDGMQPSGLVDVYAQFQQLAGA